MRLLSLIVLVILLLVIVSCRSVERPFRPGEQIEIAPGTDSGGLNYLLYVPPVYDGTSNEKWPVLLFLHGAGERGDDLERVKVHGPPKLIEEGKEFPFIVVSPQCPEDDWWTQKLELLMALLDDIESGYHVDLDRLYVTGLSMGGYGAWHLAATYPNRFAAIVPICGGGPLEKACRMKEVSVWAFHGARDEVVPLQASRDMVNAVGSCGGSAKLTVHENDGHDSWTRTYENPAVYNWLLSHTRGE